MISYLDAKYLKHECKKLHIKVCLQKVQGDMKINIMDDQFSDYGSAQRCVQTHQAEQGARWAAYRPKVELPHRAAIENERCSGCDWLFKLGESAHYRGDEEVAYCSPSCLEISQAVQVEVA